MSNTSATNRASSRVSGGQTANDSAECNGTTPQGPHRGTTAGQGIPGSSGGEIWGEAHQPADSPSSCVTTTHRLVLPADSNHHGTLYAGQLCQLALEAAYVAGCKAVGPQANLVLRRVLSLECYRPVPVGTLAEIQGAVLYRSRAYLVVGLLGSPFPPTEQPWMDGLFGFAQLDGSGRLAPLPDSLSVQAPASSSWVPLQARLRKLLQIRNVSS